jgi:hypothetical protein
MGPTEVFFGNTFLSRGVSFTFAPGVQPSVCYINTIPHVPSLPSVGDLLIRTQGGVSITFPECCLEQPQLNAGIGGQFWTLPILDRRWKWRFGTVDGHYNKRKANGTYIRERTPQELAALLLDELGETQYDVSQLPNDQRPEKLWISADIATELDELCFVLGCQVVLNPLSNRVEIWKVGTGNQLPFGGTRGASYTPILPATPSSVRVDGGPTLFQAWFSAYAVGLDTDGKYKPIGDLSYMPSGGWGKAAALAGFPEITGFYKDFDGREVPKRDLANATVWKAYRIEGLASGGWAVPLLDGTPLEPISRKDIVFHDFRADEEIAPDDSSIRNLPVSVFVKHALPLFVLDEDFEPAPGLPIAPFAIHRHAYQARFDPSMGIVWFPEPTFYIGATGFTEATVRIECAFHAGKDGVLHRHSIESNTGAQWQTPPRVISRDDVTRTVIYRCKGDANFSIEDNEAATSALLQPWLTSALSEYTLRQGGTVRYDGLRAISIDGLTQQITWAGGGGEAATTTVSQAQRHNRVIAPPDRDRERRAAIQTRKDMVRVERTFGPQGLISVGGS